MLELMILAYLNQGPQYGYQLMERLKRYKPNHNRVYPLLWKLQEQGLVSMEEQSVSRRPRRKVYSLTNAGRTYFLTLLGQVEPEEFLESEEFLFRVEHFPLMDKKPPHRFCRPVAAPFFRNSRKMNSGRNRSPRHMYLIVFRKKRSFCIIWKKLTPADAA